MYKYYEFKSYNVTATAQPHDAYSWPQGLEDGVGIINIARSFI